MIQKDTLKDAFKRRRYKNPKTLVIGTWSPALTCIFNLSQPPGAVHLPPLPPERERTLSASGGGGQEGCGHRSSPFIVIPSAPSAPGARTKTREGVKQPLLIVSWVPTVKGSRRLHQPSGYVCIQGSGGPIFGFLITPLLKLNCSFIKRILS